MSLNRDALVVPDPEVEAYLAKIPPPEPTGNDISAARAAFHAGMVVPAVKAAELYLPPESQYNVQDHRVPVEGGEITVRVVKPTPAGQENKTYPLLVWYHGGAWMLGGLEQDDFSLRTISVKLQVVIVNVDYRLAPEFVFPTGVNDSYAALKWAAENATVLSVDLSKGFIVGGLSSGGNLATIMAHRALTDTFFENRRITGQLLQIPITCHPAAYPDNHKDELLSFETIGEPKLLAKEHMIGAYYLYQGSPTDPEVSPLLYPSHANLPPAFVQACGIDPLRDEGILYERLLREDGVKTKLEVYPGVGHAFFAIAWESKSSKKFIQDFHDGLGWLLQGA